ncbi:MAG: hypothetical protein ACR2PL_28375 [Dehalococcoidia bacterium]
MPDRPGHPTHRGRRPATTTAPPAATCTARARPDVRAAAGSGALGRPVRHSAKQHRLSAARLHRPRSWRNPEFGRRYPPIGLRSGLARSSRPRRRPTTGAANAHQTPYAYDNDGQVTSISHAKGGTMLVASSYQLDPAGNRTQKPRVGNGLSRTENYGYDKLNRLSCATTISAGANPCSGANTTGFAYDGVGNLTGTVATDGGGTATTGSAGYSNANRLGCAWGSGAQSNPCSGTGTTSYGFDQNGKLTTRGAVQFPPWGSRMSFLSNSVP